MRILLLLILALSSSQAKATSVAVEPKGIAAALVALVKRSQLLQDKGLITLVTQRCGFYLTRGMLSRKEHRQIRRSCWAMARGLVNEMEPEIISYPHPISGITVDLTVVFTSEILEIAQTDRFLIFIQQWNQAVNNAAIGLGDANLFEMAEKYAGSEVEALRWLAVMFQDTSAAKTQIEWMGRQELNPKQKFALEKVNAALDMMILIYEGSFKTRSRVEFYPSALANESQNLSERFYHYYVMAYLSAKLAKAGHANAYAAFGPFLFNYLYEMIDHGPNPLMRLLSEPASIENPDSLKDIYTAYLGSLQGVGELRKAKEGSAYIELFSQNPKVGLTQSVLPHLKNGGGW